MSKGDNSPGMSHLAGVMTGLIRDASSSPPVLDFGIIQGDGSLLTNMYPIAIPATDYLVCRSCVLPDKEEVSSYETEAKNKAHRHKFDDELILEGETTSAGDPAHTHKAQIPMLDIVTMSTTVNQVSHAHTVNIARPSERCLKAGDRVLVAWVFNDAVVIDIIKSASEIFISEDHGYG